MVQFFKAFSLPAVLRPALQVGLLTVLAFLAPLQSDAMIRQSAIPDTYAPVTCLADEARTPIFEETPEYVAYLVETGEGRYWVICRNDPVNNVDPLGLVGNAPGKQMGLVDGPFNYVYANQWYEPEPLMAAVNFAPLALNAVDRGVNSAKKALNESLGGGAGDAAEFLMVMGTAGITKVPRLAEGAGYLVSKAGTALSRTGRFLSNGMKWWQMERPLGSTVGSVQIGPTIENAGELVANNGSLKQRVFVIGEGMDYVKAAVKELRAKGINAKWYQAWGKNFPKDSMGRPIPMNTEQLEAAKLRNARVIMDKINKEYEIYNIGPDGRLISPFFKDTEIRLLNDNNYPTIPYPRPKI